jgi:trimeric autotransporter adhesin
LQPVTYNLDATGIDTYVHPNGKKLLSPKQEASDKASLKTKERILYSGFIAQDVEASAKKLGYNFSGVDAPKNDKDLYSLRYAEFVVPLVKAVQELSSKNDSLQTVVDSLQSQINSIVQQITALKSGALTSVSSSNSYVQQNAPNPFSSTTLINYYIPSMQSGAQMVITNSGGQVVKSVVLSSAGYGQVTINAGELAAGSYFYTLYIDGQSAGTKQMVLTK